MNAGANKRETAARKAALDVLNALDEKAALLDSVLDSPSAEGLSILSRTDRNLANAIIYGVLRWRRLLDRLIKKNSSLPPEKISPQILNILRIAVFQILFLDRVPDFAAVDTSVEIAKLFASKKGTKFVNGVLRGLIRSRPPELESLMPQDAEAALGVSRSFPDWLVRRRIKRLGIRETEKLCDAENKIPPLTLRTNTLKTDRKSLENELSGVCRRTYAAPYAPLGICIEGPSIPLEKMEPFRTGLFQVQDEAAQLVAHFLSPAPGETVLDACAGMGGKTGHIAQLMENEGSLYAADSDAGKLEILEKEMDRLGVTMVNTLEMNLESPDRERLPDFFDRILLDAPCSGIGVIRRNPDIKWKRKKKDIERCAGRQLRLLEALCSRVKPSGILVYAVCSTEPEETVDTIEKFLKAHPDFEVSAEPYAGAGRLGEILDERGFFLSMPHVHNMDGFFAVRLRRT